MKKRFLALVAASCALVSMAQARFYVGVEGGYSSASGYETGLSANSVTFAVPSTGVISNAFKSDFNGFSIGGVLGTENFYGRYFGTRWEIGAGYTQLSVKGQQGKSQLVDAGLAFDLLLNFVNTGNYSFGVFGGVSADYHYGINASFHSFDFNGRAGVTTLLANHNRIELFVKLPIASMNVDNSVVKMGGGVANARTTFGASYKFVF